MPKSSEVTKEEVIQAMRTCAARLGRYPTYSELNHELKVSHRKIKKFFGSYTQAVRDCGFEPQGCGYDLDMEELFLDWAKTVRHLGKVPTGLEYEGSGRYSRRPFQSRFGKWGAVPARLLAFAEGKPLAREWQDVMTMAKAHMEGRRKVEETFSSRAAWTCLPGATEGRPVYGEPLLSIGLATAPTNEQGVVLLFGMVARQMGFVVLRIQTEFPDGEALRQVEHKKWQRVRIEFELESRNFLLHGHDEKGCELIVCWEHNWPECPLEVLELKKVMQGMGEWE